MKIIDRVSLNFENLGIFKGINCKVWSFLDISEEVIKEMQDNTMQGLCESNAPTSVINIQIGMRRNKENK